MMRPLKRLLLKTRRAVRPPHLALGSYGEAQALEYLKHVEQYSIVAFNYRIPLGRGTSGRKISAEIDIIAYDGDTLVFVEVKTRSSDEFVPAQTAVDLQKQRKIARAGHRYRHVMKVLDEPYRYDVVTVISDSRGDRVELFRGYFDDSVFHRGRYFRLHDSGNPPAF
jgi:putative endonuclease